MIIHPRNNIEDLKPCAHGGLSYPKNSTMNDHMLDLSVSINPLGPALDMQEIVKEVALDAYPDRFSVEASFHLAKYHYVKKENIVIGNGSAEIIQAICLAYLKPGDKTLSFSPTFLEYKRCSELMNAKYESFHLSEKDMFRLDSKVFTETIRRVKPKIVFLCNPNNPTGHYFNEEDFKKIVSASEHALIVLDEAYVNFVDEPWNPIPYIPNGNLIILRSMTKDYALTALRIGYAIAHKQICENLRKVLPPWNVNSYAQKMVVKIFTTLDRRSYFKKTRYVVNSSKRYLIAELQKLHISYIPSAANFLLIKLPYLKKKQLLFLKHAILVRECRTYGINKYIRIAVRTKPDTDLFLNALHSVLEKNKHYANR